MMMQKNRLVSQIEQMQNNLFEFPLEIGFSDGNKTIIQSC